MSKLYGLMVVKDEADVVEQSIVHAMQYCNKTVVIDNMSSDGTWEIIRKLSNDHPTRIVALMQTAEPFHDGLRAIAYNAFHEELSAADWWLRLDADEFLNENPASAVDRATTENSDFVRANMACFALTDLDVLKINEGTDSRSTPIELRRRYYRVNWREFRLFRNDPLAKWDSEVNENFPQGLSRSKVCSKSLLIRHYSERDIIQVAQRLANRAGSASFLHVDTQDWRSCVVPAKRCRYYSAESAIKHIPLVDFWPRRIVIEVLNKLLKYSFSPRMTSLIAALGRRIR